MRQAVCHFGESTLSYGRFKDSRKSGLVSVFRKYGVKLQRFKTSTPLRIKETA
ncbi:MAG: FAD-dependent oxidoreductase [Candidatus Hodgkinia cicadicola]